MSTTTPSAMTPTPETPETTETPGPPTVSVVVATYNRPVELDRLLRGLAAQQTMPCEVIIVDDGSEPAAAPTLPHATDGVQTTRWQLIRQQNAGPGAARDAAIRASSGEIIIVVDDDMEVTARLVTAHVDALADGADVVQGHFEDNVGEGRPLHYQFLAAQQAALFERCAADPSAFEPVRLATGNVSFRRKLYDDVGGFDLSLRRREDSELGIRLAAAGASFTFCPERTAIHDEPNESLQQWLQLAYEYGESERAIADRHPELYQPWDLLRDMPAPAQALIQLTRSRPRVMRSVGRAAALSAQGAGRIGATRVAVKGFGLAFVLHWFAGMSASWAGSPPALSSPSRAATGGVGSGTQNAGGVGLAVDFGGVPVDVVDLDAAVDEIIRLGDRDRVSVVVTPNVDHLVLFRRNPSFARTYRRANLVLADGTPLVALSRLLRLPLRDKVSGSDLIMPLIAAAADHGSRVFLLGSTDETAATAAAEMSRCHPEINIVGRSSPWFTPGALDPGDENPGVVEALTQVRAARPDIVLLAFGAPKQEELLDEFATDLPAACYVCCGASLDFVAGHVSRAPAWLSKWGLEWAYRLAKEPRRLWKRYLVRDAAALPIFARMTWRRLRGADLVMQRPESDGVMVEAHR